MPEILIGNYHLEIDGDYDDPLVHNNASNEKILIDGKDITAVSYTHLTLPTKSGV